MIPHRNGLQGASPCRPTVRPDRFTEQIGGLLNRQRWNTRIELANAMFEYLEIWHNRHRRHGALGWLPPVEFETRNKIIAV